MRRRSTRAYTPVSCKHRIYLTLPTAYQRRFPRAVMSLVMKVKYSIVNGIWTLIVESSDEADGGLECPDRRCEGPWVRDWYVLSLPIYGNH